MKKDKKKWVTLIVVLVVVILAIVLLARSPPETSEDVAKCIGTKATLYVQLGCHACELQEEMFGDNYEFLSTVDCFFERDKCINEQIQATPTWVIDGERHLGARSVEEIQNLTGC